jgi:hypothetical protein
MPPRPSKNKRQRQNRQERQARQARSARAGEATAISRGEREAIPTEPSRATAKDATGKGGAGRRQKRSSPFTIPGQRAVVMALMFTIVSGATLLLAPVQVQREVDADDPVLEQVDDGDINERDEEAGTVTYVDDAKLLDEEGPAVAAGVLLTPVLITGIAVWFTKKPQRSTVWTMCMIALAAFVFLFAGPYGIITLPSMIALAIGGFQSRRAESKERLAALRAEKAAKQRGERGEGDVIDVDAVEEVEGDRR